MLLAIAADGAHAEDLSYLLHKHPGRTQEFSLKFGTAYVFYPTWSATRCEAALLLEIDAVELARRRRGASWTLFHYVNDRPYAASSFLSVALARVFGTAMSARCDARPDRVHAPMRLEARLSALPCRGGEAVLRRLFEPLGYEVETERLPLDPQFADWGNSKYVSALFKTTRPLHELLTHLYVLMPVLDDEKHYYVGEDEVDKLLKRGGDWLENHPERQLIAERYLRRHRPLVRAALARMREDASEAVETEEHGAAREGALERKVRLNEIRLKAAEEALKENGAATVLDLGCGDGKLLSRLRKEKQFVKIVGADISSVALGRAHRRLRLDRQLQSRERIQLIHSALTYEDRRLKGFDAAALIEVIEHIDPPRLKALEMALFQKAQPRRLVVTTPNREYNARFETLPPGKLRHTDHRFEWTRAEFQAWIDNAAKQYGYSVHTRPVGEPDAELGPPTQMAIFDRKGAPR